MALSADRETPIKVGGAKRHGYRPVAADAIINLGALIGIDSDGYVVPADDAASIRVIGIAEKFVDNTDGDDGDVSVPYVTGVTAEFTNSGGLIGQADPFAFAEDDDAVTDYVGSTNKNYVGPVTAFTATKAWVYVDEAAIAAYYAAIQYGDANDST
jgi:hypothetical protein